MDFRFTLSHTPKQSVESAITLPDNSLGVNVDNPVREDWTLGSTPSIHLPYIASITVISDIWSNDYTFSTGLEYTINYNIDYSIPFGVSSSSVEFLVLDGANNVLLSDSTSFPGSGTGTLNGSSNFTAPSGGVKYGFRVSAAHSVVNAGPTFEIENNITGTVLSEGEPGTPTSQEISEPDGWKGCKLVLERHDDFHSLIEHYEGGAGGAFIFYGNNGQENGGIDYLRHLEDVYGFDVQVEILTEFSFDSILYEEIFTGLVDLSAKDEMVDNMMQAPIIRDDLWVKFINRRDTQVDLSSNVDLDGNIVDPLVPVTVNLISQKIRKEYSGTLSSGKAIYEDDIAVNEYIQYDFDNEIVSEIDDKHNSFIASNPALPVDIIECKEAGTYTIDFRLEMSIKNHGGGAISECGGAFVTDPTSAYIDVFVRINNEDNICTSTDFIGQSTVYTYSGAFDLNVGDQIRIYAQVTSVAWELPNSVDSILIYGDDNTSVPINIGEFSFNGVSCELDDVVEEERSFTVPSGSTRPTYLTVTADTTYAATTAQGYFIHDLLYGIVQRICGRGIYSEFLGSTYTNARQYSDDGCGAPYVILKGLQIRQYSLSDKPFFASFNQIWNGIHNILCLGLSYELMDNSPASYVIRIEQMDHFFSEEVSINFSNVRDIHSYYDNSRIFKVVKTGFKKWETEVARSLDDPQTKRSYALRFINVGKELNLESDLIAGGLTIENTRRTTIKKSADYKYDNDNFIIAINPIVVSPEVYDPELDEHFDSVTGILNSDTRYNLILTPMRNLLRWAKFIGGCLQPYATSAYRFVAGEGNYNMASDYSCTSGNQCQAVLCDLLSERQDISLADYNSVFGYLHLAQECEMTIPMTKAQYDVINNNRKKSIGISQTDSDFTKFKIKKLVFNLIEGTATINAWPKTPFRIQVINDPIVMPDCDHDICPEFGYDDDYQAILDYAEGLGYTLPSCEQRLLQNQLVIDLKEALIWEELDLLYVFATNGDRDFAKINWKNPSSFYPSEINSPTFTINVGFNGNGVNQYLNTGWKPNPNGVNYTNNNCSIFCQLNTAATSSDRVAFGVRGNSSGGAFGNAAFIPRNAGQVYSFGLQNVFTSVGSAPVSETGFFQMRRVASDDLRLFKDGSEVALVTTAASNSLSVNDMYILAYNGAGAAINYSDVQISVFGIGSAMDGDESTLNSIMDNYLSSL